jgi:hypothetical protein
MTTISRRKVLLGGAAVTGAAWASPAVISLDRAFGVGSAIAGCEASTSGIGTGVDLVGNTLNLGPFGQSDGTQVCLGQLGSGDVIPTNDAGIAAQLVCGEFDPATSTATATTDGVSLSIGLPIPIVGGSLNFEASVVSTAMQTCTPAGCVSVGTTTLTNIDIGIEIASTVVKTLNLAGPFTLACNLSLGGLVAAVASKLGVSIPSAVTNALTGPFTVGSLANAGIVFNEQLCNSDGSFTVNGIHIHAGVLPISEDIYVSQASVHACSSGACANPCATHDPI